MQAKVEEHASLIFGDVYWKFPRLLNSAKPESEPQWQWKIFHWKD
jgi:hypothetical protein